MASRLKQNTTDIFDVGLYRVIIMYWYGLDLRWAYTDLLPGIYRHTHCVHTANDVLHDALLRFALTKNRDNIEKPHAYLRTVVRNVLADTYHEMSRFVPLTSDDTESQGAGQGIENMPEQYLAPSPEHLADLQQRLQALQRIIDCLPPRCREVFRLFRIEGLGQQEIAERLSISLNMVERHIMRALIDLRASRDLLLS
jgi:RNA polymerase sigma-70 factor (ECF subfamily)